MKKVKNIAVIIVGLTLGLSVVSIMGANRAKVDMAPIEEVRTSVYYIDLTPLNIQPYAIAYGTIEPAVELDLSAEVSGSVTYVHPDLKEGQFITAGTTILKIDDKNIKLSLAQAQATLAAKKIGRQQTELESENLKSTVASAKERLTLQQNELTRLKNLATSGNVSTSELDTQRQTILSTQNEVTSAELQLALLPSNLEVIDAEIEVQQSVVDQATLDLAHTEVVLTEDRRIGTVNVSVGSYVGTGTSLVTVSSPSSYEIEAQLNTSQFVQVLGRESDMTKMTAQVKPSVDPVKVIIPAQPLRLTEGFDSTTRMLGIVVGFEANLPTSLKGMYTQVTVRTAADDYWVVPRSAIHENNLYLVGDDNKLVIEPVSVLFYQDNYAVLEQSPSINKIIVSSVSTPVSGMDLDPTEQESIFQLMADTLQ